MISERSACVAHDSPPRSVPITRDMRALLADPCCLLVLAAPRRRGVAAAHAGRLPVDGRRQRARDGARRRHALPRRRLHLPRPAQRAARAARRRWRPGRRLPARSTTASSTPSSPTAPAAGTSAGTSRRSAARPARTSRTCCADGTRRPGFAPGAGRRGERASWSLGGRVYVAGWFWEAGGAGARARGSLTGAHVLAGTPRRPGGVHALAAAGGTLYVGGDFAEIAGAAARRAGGVRRRRRRLTDWSPALDEPRVRGAGRERDAAVRVRATSRRSDGQGALAARGVRARRRRTRSTAGRRRPTTTFEQLVYSRRTTRCTSRAAYVDHGAGQRSRAARPRRHDGRAALPRRHTLGRTTVAVDDSTLLRRRLQSRRRASFDYRDGVAQFDLDDTQVELLPAADDRRRGRRARTLAAVGGERAGRRRRSRRSAAATRDRLAAVDLRHGRGDELEPGRRRARAGARDRRRRASWPAATSRRPAAPRAAGWRRSTPARRARGLEPGRRRPACARSRSTATTVYAGGSFGTVGGAARRGAAAFAIGGGVAAWNPDVDGGAVNALARLRRAGVPRRRVHDRRRAARTRGSRRSTADGTRRRRLGAAGDRRAGARARGRRRHGCTPAGSSPRSTATPRRHVAAVERRERARSSGFDAGLTEGVAVYALALAGDDALPRRLALPRQLLGQRPGDLRPPPRVRRREGRDASSTSTARSGRCSPTGRRCSSAARSSGSAGPASDVRGFTSFTFAPESASSPAITGACDGRAAHVRAGRWRNAPSTFAYEWLADGDVGRHRRDLHAAAADAAGDRLPRDRDQPRRQRDRDLGAGGRAAAAREHRRARRVRHRHVRRAADLLDRAAGAARRRASRTSGAATATRSRAPTTTQYRLGSARRRPRDLLPRDRGSAPAARARTRPRCSSRPAPGEGATAPSITGTRAAGADADLQPGRLDEHDAADVRLRWYARRRRRPHRRGLRGDRGRPRARPAVRRRRAATTAARRLRYSPYGDRAACRRRRTSPRRRSPAPRARRVAHVRARHLERQPRTATTTSGPSTGSRASRRGRASACCREASDAGRAVRCQVTAVQLRVGLDRARSPRGRSRVTPPPPRRRPADADAGPPRADAAAAGRDARRRRSAPTRPRRRSTPAARRPPRRADRPLDAARTGTGRRASTPRGAPATTRCFGGRGQRHARRRRRQRHAARRRRQGHARTAAPATTSSTRATARRRPRDLRRGPRHACRPTAATASRATASASAEPKGAALTSISARGVTGRPPLGWRAAEDEHVDEQRERDRRDDHRERAAEQRRCGSAVGDERAEQRADAGRARERGGHARRRAARR